MAQHFPWNLNIHFDRFLASQVPSDAQCVLDVGCGDGFLAVRLAQRIPVVIGLDRDQEVVRRARKRFSHMPVQWLTADVLSNVLTPAQFDAVVSNATLHHFDDTTVAIQRLHLLLRPGGTLAIVTFARNAWYDWPYALAGALLTIVMNRLMGKWEHTAPQKWPPPLTYRETRMLVQTLLPGAVYKRSLLGRCSVVWHKPE